MAKTVTKNKKSKPQIEYEFTRRPDGRYNLWQKRYVKGYSDTYMNQVWVIFGVYNRLPAWVMPTKTKK